VNVLVTPMHEVGSMLYSLFIFSKKKEGSRAMMCSCSHALLRHSLRLHPLYQGLPLLLCLSMQLYCGDDYDHDYYHDRPLRQQQ
jgi:hypothetical protein